MLAPNEGVVALHLPTGSFKASVELEPVPRCKPITTSPWADDLATETEYLVTEQLPHKQLV